MPNPLEEIVGPGAPRRSRRGDGASEAIKPTDLGVLLEGIDQQKSNDLYEAFNRASMANGAKMSEAMWAVAMLQARVLATAEMGNEQVWVASRLQEMVAAALPAMIAAAELGRREHEGRRSHDA